jgi:hypothetical protein
MSPTRATPRVSRVYRLGVPAVLRDLERLTAPGTGVSPEEQSAYAQWKIKVGECHSDTTSFVEENDLMLCWLMPVVNVHL